MDQKTTTENSFGHKYLDTDGLKRFLDNLKDYIENRIKLIYGDNIYIDASNANENNKIYIKTYIDDKTTFGDNKDKPIKEVLEEIISEYTDHIHSITLEMSNEEGGGIEGGNLTGTEGTTEIVSGFENGENTKECIGVSYIESDNVVTKLPTFTSVELPTKGHTHSTTITPSGSVGSTFKGVSYTHNHEFKGNTSNTVNSNLLITYDDSSCTLSISTSHNHSYTPEGNITDTTITPTGSVTSTFKGTEETWDSVATQSTNKFYNKTADGETVAVVNIEIPGPGHKHKFTPEGFVDIAINYTKDTGVPSKQSSQSSK